MDQQYSEAVVLGAGISGLATAWWLKKKGIAVKVIEAASQPGGSITTVKEDGFIIDFGPNSGLNTHPKILDLVKENGLESELIFSDPSANKRYILKNNELHALPLNPATFLSTKLFSAKGKLRVLKEPFVGRSADGYYQSIAVFVKRRLGQEFLDYAINPFVAGIFAGDPEKLSVKSAFPKLYRLEEIYGGLFKGMVKGAKARKIQKEKSKQHAQMFSFKSGMMMLPAAIASNLSAETIFDATVSGCYKKDNGYVVNFTSKAGEQEIFTKTLISTIPASRTAGIFDAIDVDLKTHLNSIYYPPVMVMFLGYKIENIGRKLDGFGFLIPELEKKSFLGAIWNSSIFPGRAEKDTAAFTLFIGGARSPQIVNLPKEQLIKQVLQEFEEIMKITAKPVYIKTKFWQNAIPQYQLGYVEHEDFFDKVENENPGFYLSGNYRKGISLSDCIKNAWELTEKIVRI